MPPFFIPIIAFILWAAAFFAYLPILQLGLLLSDQWIASQLFISCLILVFAWVFSGAVTAAVLTICSSVILLYLTLSTKEPALFLQIVIYAALFLWMVFYLHRLEKKTNDKRILNEKLAEDITLAEEEFSKKEALKKALNRKILRLTGLQQFTQELKGLPRVDEAAQMIVKEVHEVLGKAGECVLYLVNPEKEALSMVAGVTRGGGVIKEKEGSIFDQWVMKKSQAIAIEDTQNDFRFPSEARADSKRLRSLCASPLITEKKVFGVLRVSADEAGVFNSEDLRVLDIFSSLGAVNLRNILLYQKMGELAIRDGLTGLYLNRYFQERLAEEVQRAEFHKAKFSVILLDIDFFKRYNDEYGHAAGDIVLKNVASVLLKFLEPMDLVARYGGEEFIVLLPNKKHKDAMAVAERIRAALEKNKFSIRRVEGSVTASFGVTSFPEGGHTKEELIRSADRCLYEAKRSGRNRVCGNT